MSPVTVNMSLYIISLINDHRVDAYSCTCKMCKFKSDIAQWLNMQSMYSVFIIFNWVHIKERGGGQIFSTSFWMWFSQAPLCRYRFKFIFDDIIFLLSGNIIEYICFWRFNSIIMTWNKWLVFTKSVIMGLNNISPWPCPLGFVCLPCVITWLYSTP